MRLRPAIAGIGLCLAVSSGCASSSAAAPRGRASKLEADIVVTDGPGAPTGRFRVRDGAFSSLVAAAEEGLPAGLYSVPLAADDPLLPLLAKLPASVVGPAPRADMPAVRITVRGEAGARAKELLVAQPTSDPVMGKLLAEVGRLAQAARARPVITVALDLHAVRPVKGGQLVDLRLVGQGARGATITLGARTLVLQAATEPAPPTPGVTPLPVEWDVVGAAPANAPAETLAAGRTLDVTIPVSAPANERRMVRAVLEGSATLRWNGQTEELRLSLSSPLKALPPGRP